MSKQCAFCRLSNTVLTREHIFPLGLIAEFPEHEHAIFENKRAVKLSAQKQVIKDVCSECNNVHLSALDNYGNKFILESFKEPFMINQKVSITYEYEKLSKWVMKILYNSLRNHPSCEWLSKNSEYIVSKDENTTSKFSLFLGTFVYMAPFMNMFPDIPFQGLSNPTIALNRKEFGREVQEYKNENIEVIYLLRLCNAIFILVCWKDQKWTEEEEKELASILPHELLTEEENFATVKRVTDCGNTPFISLVHSLQAQREFDQYFMELMKIKI